MLELLKKQYDTVEGLKGKKLLGFLAVIFVVFLGIGALIGYFKPSALNSDEQSSTNSEDSQLGNQASFQGTVNFLGEELYPDDKIKYSLINYKGEEIILLRANDDKLSIAEGLYVTVVGKLTMTKNGKEKILQVTEVSIKNGSN